MVRQLLGKNTFENKAKTQRFYKVIVLEPATAKQYENGMRGMAAVDYFITKDMYQGMPDNFEGFPQADLSFDVVNGRAELTGIAMVAPAKK